MLVCNDQPSLIKITITSTNYLKTTLVLLRRTSYMWAICISPKIQFSLRCLRFFSKSKFRSWTRRSHFLFPLPPQIALNNIFKAATSFHLLWEGSLPPRNTWSLVLQNAVSSGLMGFSRALSNRHFSPLIHITIQSVFPLVMLPKGSHVPKVFPIVVPQMFALAPGFYPI